MNPAWLASFALTLAGPPSLEPAEAVHLASEMDSPDERTTKWDWPTDEPRHMRYEFRRAEGNVSGLPIFAYVIFRQLGLSPKHTSPDAARLGPRDLAEGCTRRDPRCQAFHDDYGADYRETDYGGVAASIGAGAIGGAVRLGEVEREVVPMIEWDVHPTFVGVGGTF
jgi:hypothetical protein